VLPLKITLAIPKGKKITRFLNKEIAQAYNIKGKETGKQVQNGLRKISFATATYPDQVVFYYDGETDTLSMENYEHNEFIYHCGKNYLIPEQDTSKGAYLLVAFDTKECTIGMLKGKKLETIWHETSMVPGKHAKGGQSKERFARGREETKKQWYKRIADKLKEIVIENG